AIEAIAPFDRQVFGAPREGVLHALHKAAPLSAWRYPEAGALQAFSLGRPGCRFHQIGPVAARNLESAKSVTAAALQAVTGRAIVLDVPLAQTEYAAWLQEHGFIRQRRLRRMVK